MRPDFVKPCFHTLIPPSVCGFPNCRHRDEGDSCPVFLALNNDEEKIDTLRSFRDEVLSKTPVGREYIRLYYQWSPYIVEAMEEDEEFKKEVQELIEKLLPMIEAMVQ